MQTLNIMMAVGVAFAGVFFLVRLVTRWRDGVVRKRVEYILASIGCGLIALQGIRMGTGSPINAVQLVAGSLCFALSAFIGVWVGWEKWKAGLPSRL
jgi:hypothetical protein